MIVRAFTLALLLTLKSFCSILAQSFIVKWLCLCGSSHAYNQVSDAIHWEFNIGTRSPAVFGDLVIYALSLGNIPTKISEYYDEGDLIPTTFVPSTHPRALPGRPQ